MKFRNIILIIFALTFLSGCGPKTDISPKEMSAMLKEMYLTDQYVAFDSDLNALADSTEVYAHIIERGGYSVDVFLNSLEFYRHNPKLFKEILQNVKASVDADLDVSQTILMNNRAGVHEVTPAGDSVNTEGKRQPLFKKKLKRETDNSAETEFVFEDDNDIESIEQQDDVEVVKETVKEKKRVRERKLSKQELKELKNKWD